MMFEVSREKARVDRVTSLRATQAAVEIAAAALAKLAE